MRKCRRWDDSLATPGKHLMPPDGAVTHFSELAKKRERKKGDSLDTLGELCTVSFFSFFFFFTYFSYYFFPLLLFLCMCVSVCVYKSVRLFLQDYLFFPHFLFLAVKILLPKSVSLIISHATLFTFFLVKKKIPSVHDGYVMDQATTRKWKSWTKLDKTCQLFRFIPPTMSCVTQS